MFDIDLKGEKLKFLNYLKNVNNIVLINHRKMDGDAIGSLCGLYYLLKNFNPLYNIYCINDENPTNDFNFLDGVQIFSTDLDLNTIEIDLIISVDVASVEQLGEIYKKYTPVFKSNTWVNIDHHITNNLFGNINIVDTKTSSACEIIWDLIKEYDFLKHVTKEVSTFLLTGLITDTNNFENSNSSAKSFKTASEIMDYNPRHQDIINNIYRNKPYNKMVLWGNILEGLKDYGNSKVVWNTIPKKIFKKTETTSNDVSGLLNELILTIGNLEIGFLLVELENKSIKGSFRSKTDKIDLSEFCKKWGGGGHIKASGFTIEGKSLKDVEKEVLDELKKIIKE